MERARWKTIPVVGVVAVVVAATGGAMVASAGHDADTIHACVRGSGNVRIVDDATDCRANEDPTEWSRTGPAGPAGSDAAVSADWYRGGVSNTRTIVGGVLSPTVVETATVEPGASLLWARVNLVVEDDDITGDPPTVQCQLVVGTDILDGGSLEAGPEPSGEARGSLTLVGAVDLAAPDSAALQCSTTGLGTARANQPSLLVQSVGSVSISDAWQGAPEP